MSTDSGFSCSSDRPWGSGCSGALSFLTIKGPQVGSEAWFSAWETGTAWTKLSSEDASGSEAWSGHRDIDLWGAAERAGHCAEGIHGLSGESWRLCKYQQPQPFQLWVTRIIKLLIYLLIFHLFPLFIGVILQFCCLSSHTLFSPV